VFLLLTDRLTCPRCGPTFGLVLLATRLEERIVYEGQLGCANCRDAFPIRDGFGDLRAPPRGAFGPGLVGSAAEAGSADAADEAARLRALLGIVGGPGTLALVGEPARAAVPLARALPEMHIAALDAGLREWPEESGVSRLVSGPGLPFMDSALRGLVLDGRMEPGWWVEAARVVAPRGRAVVVRPPPGLAERLEGGAFRVLASDPETIVAARS
jgi:uncharacterized protein YbaR (Trm112 family)